MRVWAHLLHEEAVGELLRAGLHVGLLPQCAARGQCGLGEDEIPQEHEAEGREAAGRVEQAQGTEVQVGVVGREKDLRRNSLVRVR